MTISIIAFISPGSGELILIMLALIMLFGAKDAPRIFRSIQTFLDKAQRAAASFRYKIMYGDLHQGTTDEEPYDVEADYSDEEDEESTEFGVQSSETEDAEQKSVSSDPETEDSEQNPDSTEKKTLNSEPETPKLDS